MTLVSAFLVPGSPLPVLCPEVAGWQAFQRAMDVAGAALRESRPDVVLLYSTQWFAVLDEIWLTRACSQDIHVDENWHEFGELPYELYSDVTLATACIERCRSHGINARGADYDHFPIDTGTIVASQALGIGTAQVPLVVASNNLYDSPAATKRLAALGVATAAVQGKRVAVVGVGGLSGGVFTTPIEPVDDHIVRADDDVWNRRILALLEVGDQATLRELLPAYVKEAEADMGLKHLHWILGALGETAWRARTHHYGPLYGSGAAVIEFLLD